MALVRPFHKEILRRTVLVGQIKAGGKMRAEFFRDRVNNRTTAVKLYGEIESAGAHGLVKRRKRGRVGLHFGQTRMTRKRDKFINVSGVTLDETLRPRESHEDNARRWKIFSQRAKERNHAQHDSELQGP